MEFSIVFLELFILSPTTQAPEFCNALLQTNIKDSAKRMAFFQVKITGFEIISTQSIYLISQNVVK